MIHAKQDRYGLDAKIYQMQLALQEDLSWQDCAGDEAIAIYGKIQKTLNSNRQPIPEVWTCHNEYRQPFIEDTKAAEIGFLVTGARDLSGSKRRVNLDIICTVNLDKIYGNRVREDEKALSEFIKAIEREGAHDSINQVKEGISEVFTGFYTDDIVHRDMQPWYVFSVSIGVEYFDDFCL